MGALQVDWPEEQCVKRKFGLIAACLLAGVMLSYAAAWAITIWLPMPDLRNSVAVDLATMRDVAAIPTDWLPPTNGVIASQFGSVYWQFNREVGPENVPRDPSDYTVHAMRVGWPFRSTWTLGAWPKTPANVPAIWLGVPQILQPEWAKVEGRPYSGSLPLFPLWWGLLLNSVFYGSLTFGGVTAFAAWRRARRRRRGLCEGCAYPVKGMSTCPECGAAVTTNVAGG